MNYVKRTLLLLLVLAAAAPLAAQGAGEPHAETAEEPVAVFTDSYDREVIIPQKPERIVSLGPNITEILFALGRGDAVVGRTDFCDYPDAALEVDSVGEIMNPSIETVLELTPDLVITSTHVDRSVITSLEQAGVTVASIYTDEEYEGIYTTIRETAMLTGAEEQAEPLIEEMQQTIASVQQTVADAPRPRIYYVIDFGDYGDYTAGGDTFIHQLIELAGGRNIAEEISGWSISLERIIEEDPDMLICSPRYDTKERLQQAHGYQDLTAVQEGRIYEIHNDLIDRQGVRNAQGVLELAKIFHPELFDQ